MAELRLKSTGTIKLFENDNTSSVTIASPASLGGDRTITLPDASVTLASGTMNDATNLSGTVPIANGGTGSTSTTYASLTANVSGTLPIANGGTASTSTTYCDLTSNVTGNLPVGNLNSGTSASSSTFWRGDGTWVAAGGRVYVGSVPRSVTSASSNQSVTGLGFQPTGIAAFTSIGGTDAASWGVDDGTTAKCIYQNNAGTDLISNQSTLARMVTGTDGSTMYNGVIDSFDADGFTVAWTKTGTPTGDLYMNYIAWA